MNTFADKIIEHLGGTTKVAKLTEAPVSTVHSWRKNGIPPSRLAHLKLAAHVAGIPIDVEKLARQAAKSDKRQVAA
jgi:hypothetical protein